MLFTKRQISVTSQEEELVVVSLSFMNGLMFGIGHITGDEDDDFHYLIVVSFAFLQLTFANYK